MGKTPEPTAARQASTRLNALKSHLTNIPLPLGRLTKLSRSLTGRKAIITGAASGMGRETAKLFADEGVQVAILDLTADGVQAVVEQINVVHPGRARGWVCDVSDRERIKVVCKEVIDAFGGALDILVNNAGVSLHGGALDSDDALFESRWDKTVAINLDALVIFIRACVPTLLKSDAGRIVNIASTEHFVTGPGNAAYSATKSAVTGLTRSMAVELGKYGNVTVNTVCPGPIITGMTRGITPELKEAYAKRRVPLRRYADPEEVAQRVILHVVSGRHGCIGWAPEEAAVGDSRHASGGWEYAFAAAALAVSDRSCAAGAGDDGDDEDWEASNDDDGDANGGGGSSGGLRSSVVRDRYSSVAD